MSIFVVTTAWAIIAGIGEKVEKYCRQRESYKRRSYMQRMWK